MGANVFNASVLSLKDITQSKRKVGLVNFSAQVEKMKNRCVFKLFPLSFGIGEVEWLQPKCEDTAPSTFTAASGSRSPFPGHGRCSTGTNWTSGHASELAVKGRGGGGEEEEAGPNQSHYFHQCCWMCSYSIGFGKLLYRMWSKHRLEGEGFSSTRGFGVEKSCCRWAGDCGLEAKSCLGLRVSSTKYLEALGELLMWSARRAQPHTAKELQGSSSAFGLRLFSKQGW